MMITMITPRTTAAMKTVVAVEVHPSRVRFGPSPCCGGALERSSGSLPIGSTPMGSLLIGVRRPGTELSVIKESSPSLAWQEEQRRDDGEADQDGDDDGDQP